MPTYNGSPRRNEGKPDVSASGTPSPNPCQGLAPLDPADLFSWSTGVAPRYPPDSDGPDPGMTLDTSFGEPQLHIPAIQVEADSGIPPFLRTTAPGQPRLRSVDTP